MHRDVLKEISNIGAGNAATAFASMVGNRIDMKVPNISLVALSDVPELIGGAETPVVAVYFRVEGELASSLLFVLKVRGAGKLLHLFLGTKVKVDHQMNLLEQSTLGEIGNILSSSYLGALSSFTGLSFSLSTPALAMDMAGAIINIALLPISEIANEAFIVENVFYDGDNEVYSHFFLLPDPQTFSAVFSALGV